MENKVWVTRKKTRRQHPWVFSNEIRKIEGEPHIGDIVSVFDHQIFIGSGVYNSNSLISIRLFSKEQQDLNEDFFSQRIQKALAVREDILTDEKDFRLVFGESDNIPGVVIDKYQNSFALQTYSAGMDMRQNVIVKTMCDIMPVDFIVEKNNFRLRDAEHLERRENVLYGKLKMVTISEADLKYMINIKEGQKTGFYYDQRLTRAKVRTLSQGKNVLDVFCYTGGFALNAGFGGAQSVLGIDASESAINLAKQNAEINNLDNICKFKVADAFVLLREFVKEQRKFDLIILDPPPFFKSQKEKARGLRGYKDINIQAMKLLTDHGILVSSTCSHYLFWQDLLDVLTQAAQDTGRSFKIIDRTTQGPDHPVLLSMPESEYLRCFFLEVTKI